MADDDTPVPVIKYVLYVLATIVGAMIALGTIFVLFDYEPKGSGISMAVLIAGICLGCWRYSKDHKRAMLVSERLRFSVGVVLVNTLLPVAYLGILLAITGLPFSNAGLSALFGVSPDGSFWTILVAFSFFFAIISFGAAYFLSGTITRKAAGTGK